jgi:hypothetical protein
MSEVAVDAGVIDSRLVWEGYHESRRCSTDTYPESYITKYTSMRRSTLPLSLVRRCTVGTI